MNGARIDELREAMADGAERALSDVMIAAGYDPTDRKLRQRCSIAMHFARDFDRLARAKWRRNLDMPLCATQRLVRALSSHPQHLSELLERADVTTAKRASQLLSKARLAGHPIANNNVGYWWRTDFELEQEAAQ